MGILLNADRGLLSFRRGDTIQGRIFYEKALETAAPPLVAGRESRKDERKKDPKGPFC